MWAVISALIAKDLKLLVTRGSGLTQGLLLGLLVVFVFSLAQGVGETLAPQSAATVFWISSLFCQVLVCTQLYALEETHLARVGLVLVPSPVHAIWIAKTVTAFLVLLVSQVFFLPALLVFLGQSISGNIGQGIAGLLLVDLGLTSIASLLGALAQGQVSRESLLSILLFPLISPLLLAGIAIHTANLGGGADGLGQWLSLACAFDAIFFSVACFVFPFLYTGDDA